MPASDGETMTSLLDRNLAALFKADPDAADRIRQAVAPAGIELLPTRSGDTTVIVNGASLHSRFDPWQEAETLAAKALAGRRTRLALYGLGLGYHALVLARCLDRLWVVEPKRWMIRLALSHLDFGAAAGRLAFLTEPAEAEGCPALSLLPHPPSVRLDPETFRAWARRLARAETAGELRAAFGGEAGLSTAIEAFPAETAVPLKTLAREIRRRQGPLEEGETLILLLEELSRESAAKSLPPS